MIPFRQRTALTHLFHMLNYMPTHILEVGL